MTTDFKNVYEALLYIQQELSAPKGQYNKFGGYAYRSAEDILAALKPLLHDTGCILVCNERILEYENKAENYMEVTARLLMVTNPDQCIEANGLAREAADQKGMTASQLTGSAHSYAKKLALGNLFAIDDTPDDDSTNKHGKEEKTHSQAPVETKKRTRNQLAMEILSIVRNKKAESLMPEIIRGSFGKERFNDLTDAEVEVLHDTLMVKLEQVKKQ